MILLERLRDVKEGTIIAQDVLTKEGVVLLHKFSICTPTTLEILKSFWKNLREKGVFALEQKDLSQVYISPECVKYLVSDAIASRNINGASPYYFQEAQKILSVVLENNPYAMYICYSLGIHHYGTLLHSLSVAVISAMIGLSCGYDFGQLSILTLGAVLHDLGKLQIPVEVLDKKGKLSDSEFEMIRQHPTLGLKLASGYGFGPDILNIIYEHHEKINGKGYPRHLTDQEISPYAKIVTVADIFEAVTAKRSYHKQRYNFEGFKIIDSEPGLEPRVVQYVHQNIALIPKNSKVVLSDNNYAIVMQDSASDKPVAYITKIDRVVDLAETPVKVEKVVSNAP